LVLFVDDVMLDHVVEFCRKPEKLGTLPLVGSARDAIQKLYEMPFYLTRVFMLLIQLR
jgi:hypothetical protein